MKMVTTSVTASLGLKLACPYIHGNGTSGKELLNNYKAANSAIKRAIEALAVTLPNGRDFNMLDENNDYRTARKEHEERMAALHKIEAELMHLSMAVYKQTN